MTAKYINELNGYLRCLTRLNEGRVNCGARVLSNESELPLESQCLHFFQSNRLNIVEELDTDFSSILSIFKEKIFSKLEGIKIKESIVQSVLEDINEYFGLHATDRNPEGIFHPLIDSEKKIYVVHSKKNKKVLFLFVRVEGELIAVSFS